MAVFAYPHPDGNHQLIVSYAKRIFPCGAKYAFLPSSGEIEIFDIIL